jgi:hypothetical protein
VSEEEVDWFRSGRGRQHGGRVRGRGGREGRDQVGDLARGERFAGGRRGRFGGGGVGVGCRSGIGRGAGESCDPESGRETEYACSGCGAGCLFSSCQSNLGLDDHESHEDSRRTFKFGHTSSPLSTFSCTFDGSFPRP